MTQEDKELLLQDLCARLPYSTLCYCKWTKDAPNGTSGCIQEISTYLLDELMIIDNPNYKCQICEIKPYLRPISEIANLISAKKWSSLGGIDLIDWYNANHIDYRGLIEKSLALEAPKGIYNTNNE